jgi:hypothetical protein
VTSGGGKIGALLEYVVPGARGFLLLHPIIVGASDRHFSRPMRGDAYPYQGALRNVEARVAFSGSWVRQTGGKIPLAQA